MNILPSTEPVMKINDLSRTNLLAPPPSPLGSNDRPLRQQVRVRPEELSEYFSKLVISETLR